VSVIKAIAATAALIMASSAHAADYSAPYQPAPHYRAAPVYLPPLTIRQAPPVTWVLAPPQYVQDLVPVPGCRGCGPGYAAVGHWQQLTPPSPLERFFSSSGY
jgi:hypothetical protein